MGNKQEWIEACQRAIDEMLEGRFDVQIDDTASDPEARQLVHSLSALAEQLGIQCHEYKTYCTVTERINRYVTTDEILEEVWSAFRKLMSFDRLAFAQISRDGAVETQWVRADGEMSDEGLGYSAPLLGGTLADVLRSGQPRVISNLEQYQQENPRSSATAKMLEFGIRSSLTCPLLGHGRPVGFLFFSSSHPNAFPDDKLKAMAPLFSHTAHALSKSQLYQELEETKQALSVANASLANQARVDAVTGISNRRQFDEVLDSEFRRAQRTQAPLSLLLIDIDHFKRYNDCYGHDMGDDALRLVASCLDQELLRGGDVAARYGGEEFGVILPATPQPAALKVAERLRQRVEQLGIFHETSPLGVLTISVGVGTYQSANRGDPRMLVATADGALYRAKADGRDCVRVAAAGSGLRRSMTGPHIPR